MKMVQSISKATSVMSLRASTQRGRTKQPLTTQELI
jgi:hypothetical protein